MPVQGFSRVLLAFCSPDPARAALSLETDGEIAVARDAAAALFELSRAPFDLFATETALPGLDAPELVARARRLALPRMPCAVIYETPGMARAAQMARAEGACAVLKKPFSAAALCALLRTLTLRDRLMPPGADADAARRLLWSLGFSARLRGTGYLAAAAAYASRDERAIKRLTLEIYPLVAEDFGVSAEQVQHGMRRAIESAWAGGFADAQYALFGNTIDAHRAKPTAGEMIARMAEHLRTGLERDG